MIGFPPTQFTIWIIIFETDELKLMFVRQSDAFKCLLIWIILLETGELNLFVTKLCLATMVLYGCMGPWVRRHMTPGIQ